MKASGRVALSLCAALLLAGAAPAQQRISEATHRQLLRAQEQMDAGRHGTAIELLETLAGRGRLGDFEAAVVAQNLGYAYSAAGQPGKAAAALRRALAGEGLGEAVTQSLRLDLAQLDLELGEHAEAARLLEAWLEAAAKPDPRVHMLAAGAYHELGERRPAIAHARAAIRLEERPPEPWLRLLLALHYEVRDYPGAAALLEDLIARFPDRREYWTALADVYLLTGDARRAIATLELALRQVELGGASRLRLARLYLQEGSPYLAATLVEQSLRAGTLEPEPEHWRLAADAWTLAHAPDRALAALQEMGRLGLAAEAEARRGRLLMELERWDEAADALAQAASDAPREQRAGLALLLGIAAYEAGQHPRAVSAFEDAARDPQTAARASRWLQYLESESARGAKSDNAGSAP